MRLCFPWFSCLLWFLSFYSNEKSRIHEIHYSKTIIELIKLMSVIYRQRFIAYFTTYYGSFTRLAVRILVDVNYAFIIKKEN